MKFTNYKKYKLESPRVAFAYLIPLCLITSNVSAQSTSSEDHLEQLTQTLVNGAYSSEDIQKTELSVSTPANDVDLDVRATDNRMQAVLPEDYKKLKISPLYTDSSVYYDRESGDYFETRLFANNIRMYLNIFEKSALVADIDDKESHKNSWKVSCSKDRITDAKTCFLNKYELGVMKSQKYGTMLAVSKELKSLNNYIYNYIRIDKNSAHKTKGYFHSTSAAKIINEMRAGSTAYTRFQEWDGEEYEEVLSLWGFSAAYEVMNKMYERLK
ncbi:hypothetical protein HYG93_05595 [Acinetobacter sp. SwsAc6]|uniref:hypothetical protein n=1 Tax=Acinetobacter sp. SwsAc6 TaxID=2749439 RepID=UPI0015BF340E|nr:hypothetical protein [Acinetobacter sp. SwsAc6]NWK73771.1 hypothetical protein [Acinetobacter sp. SwsAc6]